MLHRSCAGPIASHSTLKASLLRVAPPILRDVIALGVNTGVRVASELLTLTWAEVDFQRNQLTVQASPSSAVCGGKVAQLIY